MNISKTNKTLLEGGRITGTASYKDFLRPGLDWTVVFDNNRLLVKNSAPLCAQLGFTGLKKLEKDRPARVEAIKCASAIIKAVENEMLNRKPNELADVISKEADKYTIAAFGRAGKSAYDELASEKQRAAKTFIGGLDSSTEAKLVTKVNQAAFAMAIVYKYFEEQLKDSRNRRSGLKRALNNMSEADKAEIKAWLQDHVAGIKFIVPYVDSDADVSITDKDGLEDVDKTAEVLNKLNSISSSFKTNYPNAKEGTDFVYRHTAKEADTRKDLWNLGALVTFDTKVADVPEKVRILIQDAKRQSTQETKSMADMADEYSVSSVPLAQVILKLFDNDFNFYKNNGTSIADGSDELINDYL